MATLAIKPTAAPLTPRGLRITFKKRQQDARLWNSFYSTVSMSKEDAQTMVEELNKAHPTMDFTYEVAKA